MELLDFHLDEKDSKSRDFILRVADQPSINHALTSYFISTYFPPLYLSKSLDSLKSNFTFFDWNPHSLSTDKDFQLYLRKNPIMLYIT